MYSEVPVPKSLEAGRSFEFLRRDLRRTGLVVGGAGSPGGSPGGGHFDSSLHNGGGGGGGGGVPGLPPAGAQHGAGMHGGIPGHFGAG